MEHYEQIKELVENTTQPYRAIAVQYGTNHTQIIKIAKKDGWSLEHRVSKNSTNEASPPPAPHTKILGKIALRKIEEVKNELGKDYSSVDEPLIVMYAKNYERYIDLEKDLMEAGILSYSVKTGSEYLSPKFTALLAIQKNLVTIANQLGLSIASRKRLGLKFEKPGQEQSSIFDFARELSDGDFDIDDI